MSVRSPSQLCDCPNPRPGRPFHCAAEEERNADFACPNGACEHSAYVHDLESLDDPRAVCCIEDCRCGKPIAAEAVEPGARLFWPEP